MSMLVWEDSIIRGGMGWTHDDDGHDGRRRRYVSHITHVDATRGEKMDPMLTMMLSASGHKRSIQKKDQQDMMDKAMQIAMLKWSAQMDDPNPMNPYMMNGGMGARMANPGGLGQQRKGHRAHISACLTGYDGPKPEQSHCGNRPKERFGARNHAYAAIHELKQANNGPIYVHDRQFQDEFRPCGPTGHVTPVISGAI